MTAGEVRRSDGFDLVVPPHRDGGQAQYVVTPVRARPADTLADVLDWASGHLGEGLSVARLAGRAAMSERTFARLRSTTPTAYRRTFAGTRRSAPGGAGPRPASPSAHSARTVPGVR
jgi:transcriptional regulator GlxA family with amidase domain